jgi:hypothetical protein
MGQYYQQFGAISRRAQAGFGMACCRFFGQASSALFS